MTAFDRADRLLWILLATWLGCLPLYTDTYGLEVMALALIRFQAILGLYIAFALAGQMVLCQGSLVGLGAYAFGILRARYHWWFVPATAAGLLVGAAGGSLIGLAATRVRGHYFAILTLSMAIVSYQAVLSLRTLTGGAAGITGIPSAQIGASVFYWMCFALAVASAWYVATFSKGPVGFALSSVRSVESLAAASGLNPAPLKLLSCVMCGCLAGLAGALNAQLLCIVTPEGMGLQPSVLLLLTVALGGRGSLLGLVAATYVAVVLPEEVPVTAEVRFAMFGLVILLIAVVMPGGINEFIATTKAWTVRVFSASPKTAGR